METEIFLQLSSKTVTSEISDKEKTSQIDLLCALNNENIGVCYNLDHGKHDGKGRAFGLTRYENRRKKGCNGFELEATQMVVPTTAIKVISYKFSKFHSSRCCCF